MQNMKKIVYLFFLISTFCSCTYVKFNSQSKGSPIDLYKIPFPIPKISLKPGTTHGDTRILTNHEPPGYIYTSLLSGCKNINRLNKNLFEVYSKYNDAMLKHQRFENDCWHASLETLLNIVYNNDAYNEQNRLIIDQYIENDASGKNIAEIYIKILSQYDKAAIVSDRVSSWHLKQSLINNNRPILIGGTSEQGVKHVTLILAATFAIGCDGGLPAILYDKFLIYDPNPVHTDPYWQDADLIIENTDFMISLIDATEGREKVYYGILDSLMYCPKYKRDTE